MRSVYSHSSRCLYSLYNCLMHGEITLTDMSKLNRCLATPKLRLRVLICQGVLLNGLLYPELPSRLILVFSLLKKNMFHSMSGYKTCHNRWRQLVPLWFEITPLFLTYKITDEHWYRLLHHNKNWWFLYGKAGMIWLLSPFLWFSGLPGGLETLSRIYTYLIIIWTNAGLLFISEQTLVKFESKTRILSRSER